jgi:hypothetical protein
MRRPRHATYRQSSVEFHPQSMNAARTANSAPPGRVGYPVAASAASAASIAAGSTVATCSAIGPPARQGRRIAV